MRKSSIFETLEDLLLGRSYKYEANLLSHDDNQRVAHALCMWLLVLHDLAVSYDLDRCYSYANLRRLAGRLVGCDIKRLVSELKSLTQQLRLWNPLMGDQSLRSYKEHFDQTFLPDSVAKEIIWPFITVGYRVGVPASWYRDINTISQFLVRLTLKDVDWIIDENIDSYLQLESEMRNWDYPSFLVEDLRQIILEWFGDFTVYPEDFSHSSGATLEVARGKGIKRKFRNSVPDPSGLYLLQRYAGGVHPLFKGQATRSRLETFTDCEFVPKGVDKKRVVSPESTFHQYVQSGFARSMITYLDRHPSIGIPIRDQEISRRACLKASATMDYCTFDLSSASDTVTYRLAKDLLYGTPLQPLLLGRTPTIRVTKRDKNDPHAKSSKVVVAEVKAEKLFAMGSICCFPVEAVVFAACCRLACNIIGCRRRYYVYGDDIIIPAEAADVLRRILSELHFILNEDKSYGPYSPFLEACGMEAYMGTDISPCRIPRRLDIVAIRSKKSPASVLGGVELCNRLYQFGLFTARRYLVAHLLRFYAVAFSVDPERGIYHPNPDNQHLRCRYNRDLQRTEYLCWGIAVQHVENRKRALSTDSHPRFYYGDSDESSYVLLLEKYARSKRSQLLDPKDLIELHAGPTRVADEYRWRALNYLPKLPDEEWKDGWVSLADALSKHQD